MTMKLNRWAYAKVIMENLEWLDKQPPSLEREHIRLIVETSLQIEFPIQERTICDEDEYEQTVLILDKMLNKIEAYEKERWPFREPTPEDAEEFRRDQMEVKVPTTVASLNDLRVLYSFALSLQHDPVAWEDEMRLFFQDLIEHTADERLQDALEGAYIAFCDEMFDYGFLKRIDREKAETD